MPAHSHSQPRLDPAPLSVRVDELDTDLVRVSVAGEVDLSTAATLREELEKAVRSPGAAGRVQVDLAGVTFLDSTGVSVLLGAHGEARRAARTLTVTNPQRRVHRVLEITSVLDRLGLPPHA